MTAPLALSVLALIFALFVAACWLVSVLRDLVVEVRTARIQIAAAIRDAQCEMIRGKL